MKSRLLLLVAVLALFVAACDSAGEDTTTTTAGGDGGGQTDGQTEGSTLDAVRSRGTLICGVNDTVPGFGFVDEEGNFQGFDVDYCRAVAAAVLGDSEAVEFRPLTAQQRFTALQSGEIDVLIRNTTWTSSRDGTEAATFATTTFYDGQGMMVAADSGIEDLDGLDGATICVLQGTTTELNLASVFGARGLDFTPLTFASNDELLPAFLAGQCEGYTSDRSQLGANRSAFPTPDDYTILEVVMSKEPLGPVTRDGDTQWAQVVDWVVLATIQAEEFGIDSGNVDGFSDSEDPAVRRFLGLEVETESGPTTFDPGLGLEPGWTMDVISQVGNYAEIYERNVAPIGIPRGVNSLWTDGGLLYPPPYR